MKTFCALFVLVFSLFLIFVVKESEPVGQNMSVAQNLITTPGPLLNSKGELIEVGWAKYPIKEFNIDQIQIPVMNKFFTLAFNVKKWDFFSFMTRKFVILLAVADLGYIGNTFVHVYDLESDRKYFVDKDILPWRIPKFPANSCNFTLQDEFKYETGDYMLSYSDSPDNTSPDSAYLTRRVQFRAVSGGVNLKGDFTIRRPRSHEDLALISPLSDDSKRFYYNVKAYTMPASGTLSINDLPIVFSEDITNGGMDYGRGIWNYNTFWVWASGNGFLPDGTRIGINLGGGFQSFNLSNATEDSVFVNGRIIKLNVARFEFDEEELEYVNNWRFVTEDQETPGSCNIEFNRKRVNLKKTDFHVLKSQLKQYFGTFRGWVIDETGGKIEFEDIVGMGEAHRARW